MTTVATSSSEAKAPVWPSFGEAFRVWLKIGFLSFGGPAGQIALMHRTLVDERRWIGEAPFLHALNYCMLLPGPEAQQLATYVGWRLHGLAGGLVAGTLFVLPGAVVILVLAALYQQFHDLGAVAALFLGIKAAVLAVVIEAVHRIGKRVLRNRVMYAVAAAAFVGIFVFDLPFPLIVLGAGAAGLVGVRLAPERFAVIKGHDVDAGEPATPSGRHWRQSIAVLAVGLPLWFAPLVLAAWLLGRHSVFLDIGLFFSKLAVVTFGGAYAVLAYMAQQAVTGYGWLAPGEMLDGLGLAETTPGPLILVTEFVGYLAAYRLPGPFSALGAGVLGAAATLWVTFVPCFIWIFLGAPYIERLSGKRQLSAALSCITAAVVGVVLNLALWFGLHVLFAEVTVLERAGMRLLLPSPASLQIVPAALAVLATLSLLRFRLGVAATLGLCGALGLAWKLAVG